ncbi:heparan-alpha-glucosaminide N-acetyltransferase domain-containing protein [Xanthomonas sp. CFBP 8445]|uniref:DUF1624 domain-containing protein n=1 Tax=Xanthomonas sp. CFBP 8445 TaxID=2971236 RepID=UPI0021DFE013|nr:heparan-alpha-glucosaminide N-acetyltransferase domain-containing protein [Xanthomonas sp. CFBP 8445]UYC12942.1 heparan-alpha-glucosaminide N-acetyltransferase domain-containing protein [Xanthomonas sp. CFBP 8445]
MPSVALASPTSLAVPATPAARLASIDLLRGTVMLLMLLDHVRETFYLHHPVGDPMEVEGTAPALFVARTLAHLCAPVFVFLTGLSAWLYAARQADGRAAAASFLLKRGLFLIVLELTLVNLAWSGAFPPQALYLQVIWAIGLSMLALAALLWLPRPALALLGAALVAGHHLLDEVQVQGDGPLAAVWAVLHDRRWLELGDLRLRTSYPVLPWIGVIALGYAAGPWYGAATDPAQRQQRLLACGLGALAGFHLLRWHNGYGDAPWQVQDDLAHTAMSFFNVTKYPPSLQFLLLTLGVGLLLLRLYEHPTVARALAPLAAVGAAPMFFYLLHLYVLKLAYLAAVALWGANQGDLFGVDSVAALWAIAALLGLALYWPTAAFARLKARRRDLAWLRYF